MLTPVIGVLALQGDVREHSRALAAAGARTRSVRRLTELDDLDGLVVPGGESTTMSKLAVELDLLDPIAAKIKEGFPVYGSCAGMIMLADRVLDGRPDQRGFGGIDMTVRRNAFGRQVDSFEAEIDFDGAPLTAIFIRAPWVEELGPGATVVSQVAAGERAGRIVAVRQGSLLATAFHPEITGDLRVHQKFVEMVRSAA